MEWNFVKDNGNIVNERLKVGREYLVKAWAEFDRCEE